MKHKIKIIEPLGFCYGVKRAVNLAEQTLKNKSNKRICSLGDIIHNKDAVRLLSQKGLVVKNSLNGMKRGDAVIISSHGIRPTLLREIKRRGIQIIDATCPNVITSQRLCQRLKKENYFIVIVGDKHHKEIESLRGFAGKNSIVIRDEKEAKNIRIGKRIGVVVQTTQSKENYIKILEKIIAKDYNELRIFNTICDDTSRRQKAALDSTKEVDAMFVVGGKHSANTRWLFELCRKKVRKCYYIENDKELKPANLKNSKIVGVVSGASTPDWIIENVLKKVSEAQTYGTK